MSYEPGSRFTEYTPTDHQAPLWIATSITLTYTGLFVIVRLAVKYKVLNLDDVFLGFAHVFGLAQWAIMFAALKGGVGKRGAGIERRETAQMTGANLVYVSRIMTMLTLGFTKCSVILFLRQLFSGTANKGWRLCNVLLVGACVWTVASVMMITIGCHPSGSLYREDRAQCAGDLARWGAVTGIDVLFELVLVVVPAYLFYSVKISRSRKFTIVGAFATRIAVPALFIAYYHAYMYFRNHTGTSIDVVGPLVWQQVLCCYSLVSPTTPCLKGFLLRFNAIGHFTLPETYGSKSGSRTYGTHSKGKTTGDSYVMQSIDRKNSKSRRRPPPIDEPPLLAARPPDVVHSAIAYAETPGESGDGSVKSFGSDKMMIHRKVEYDVTSS